MRSEMIAAAGCVCLLAALSLWLGARVSRQRQLLSMERMRGSALYADLYALVCIARQHDLDEVRVERDRVSFFSMQPAGCLGRFDLTVGGYRYLNDRQVLALSQEMRGKICNAPDPVRTAVSLLSGEDASEASVKEETENV